MNAGYVLGWERMVLICDQEFVEVLLGRSEGKVADLSLSSPLRRFRSASSAVEVVSVWPDDFGFFAFRKAFLDGGSGALTSISSSVSSNFRLLGLSGLSSFGMITTSQLLSLDRRFRVSPRIRETSVENQVIGFDIR